MRRVLKHHVCFCFLSTALLAGVSLIAAQEKVYAGSQGNCRVAVDTGSDGSKPIVCDGSDRLGGGGSVSVSDGRTIDMSKYPGWPAVEVYGENADITMSGTLRVTNGDGRDNTYPAIKVHGGGGLKLVDATIVNVSKGIVAESEGAVTVMTGLIGVKKDGVVVEVKNRGKVTLMMKGRGVTVEKGGNSTGIVMDGDGTVELMGTGFTDVKTGIKIKGAGKASVTMTGKGTTITVGSNGKGIVMEGQGEAEVTGGTIEGSGSVVGAVVKDGTLTLVGTSFTKVTTGAEVSGDGKLKIEGSSTKITVTKNGVGLNVSGKGSATVTNVKIVGKGDGSGDKGTGVVMMGTGTVELNKVEVESFLTGVSVSDGTVKINGESTITAEGDNGVGVRITETGKAEVIGATIEAKGQKAVGIKVEGQGKANVTVMGGKIVGKGDGSGQGVGVDMAGEGEVTLTSVGVEGFETGVKVTNGTMKIEGSSKITATGQKAVGLQITGEGKAIVTGGEISIGGVFGRGATMGVSVTGTGEAELMNVKIKGNEKGTSTGVEVNTLSEEGVKLTNVEIEGVTTGVSVSEGKVMISGESKIAGISTGLSVQGGTVTMMGGTISEGGVSVEDGTLMLEDVEIEGVTTGVTMSGGTFKMIRGKITGNGNVVNVTGGEKAELTNVKIVGSGGGNGVYMAGKGEVTLEDVEIEGVTTGVTMSGGGTLTVKKGEIKEFKTSGVNVEAAGVESVSLEGTKIIGKGGGTSKGVSVGSKVKSAELTLTDVTVSQVGTGVYVKSGATASLTLTGVTIEGVEKGVQMLGGKKLVMERGSIGFTRSYGVNVGGEMTQLTKTVITGSGEAVNSGVSKGVYATGGEVTLTDVEISQVATGVSMMGGGTLMMTKGEIKEFTTEGMSVGISVISATLTGTIITGKGGGTGVKVEDKATASLTLTDVKISKVATGVEMKAGNDLTISGGMIKGVQKGVHVTGGGTLTMNQGSIEFKGNGYGVYVGKGVTKADLTNVTVTGKGGGQGVYVAHEGKVAMTLADVTVSGVQTGVEMNGTGALMISGSSTIEFTSDNGYGVYVGSSVTRADLRNVTVTGKGGGQGVYVAGGKVTLTDVKIERVGTGVRMMGGNDLTVTKGSITNVQIGVVMMGDGALTVSGTTEINFAGGYGVYVGSSVKSATLTKTKIMGKGGGQGVYVAGGKVALTDVMVSKVGIGVQMMGAGSLTMNGTTEIQFAGNYGVYVGGEVTRAELTKTVIRGEGNGSEYGVYAGDKVMGEVTMTTITGRRSHEVRGALRGRTVRLEGVQISGVQKGVHVTGGGTLTMNQGSIEFKGNGYGVYVGKGVTKADLTGTKITGEGKGVGVYAMGGRTMVMALTDVKISGVGMGIFAAGGGMLAIGGTSTIGFQGKYGVYVGKDVMGEVAMTTITGSGEAVRSGTGVYVNGGAAWLGGTTLKSVAKGMTVENGIVVMQNGVIKFHGEHGVLLKQGNALLVNVGMKYEGNNADATFLKVDATEGVNKADIKGALIKIDGQGKGLGVHVMNGGRVMLKNTVLANVVKGVDVKNAQFWIKGGGITFNGEYGVNLSTGNVLLKSVVVKYNRKISAPENPKSPNLIQVGGKGSNLSAIKVMLSGNMWWQGQGVQGVYVKNGGHVTLNKSHLIKVQNAITVEEGSVWMGDGVIEFNGEHGVKLSKGQAVLTNVQMNYKGNKNADFIKIKGRESVVKALGTIINGNNQEKGADVTEGGHVVLIRSNLNKVKTGITAQNAEVTMSSASVEFKGEYGVSLHIGKAVLNKVNLTHTSDNDADFLRVQGKGANLEANKITIKGSNNKGQGLHVIRGAKITLLQSQLTGIAKGIRIDSGMVRVRKSIVTIDGDDGVGISLWGGSQKSEAAMVNLTQTVLKVPNNIVIHGKTAKGFITLKDSDVSGDLLLRAENGSAIMLATNNSLLTGGSHVDDKSSALFYLTNKSKWLLTNRKKQDLEKVSSSVSGMMLKDSAIIFERPTSDNYQTLYIGKGPRSVYLAQGDSQFHLNIQVGSDGSFDDNKTDRVLIHGNASGTTKIHMNAPNNEEETVNSKTSKNNNHQSVSIVQVSGSAKQDSFQLNYGYVTLNNSPYQYYLVAYGPDSKFGKADPQKRLVAGEGEFWDFRLESKYTPFDPRQPKPIKPAIVPQVPTYLLLPNALFYSGLMDINNQTELLGTMVTSFDPFFNGKPAFFIRGYGGSHTYTSDLSALEYGYGAKFDYRAADAAVLLDTLENEQNSAFIGVIGTYGKLSLQPQDVEKSKKSNFDNWSVTAYASLQHNMGFYVNGLLSYGLSRGNVETLARGKTASITGKPLRAALTGGKAFLTGYEGLVFEPQMQLVYQYLMFNSARDVDGFNINMGSPSQLTTRLGGRLAQEFALMEEDSSISFYGKLHLMSSFGGKQFVQFKDTFQLGAFGSSMEAGVGVQAQLSSQIALHGDMVYQQKITKAGLSGSTFSGGLRYRF
ncbi:outer membrane autotransporter barrel domain-containing protein [Bartonella sp. WD12.1]|nr:outer membrane autotransporter barrel domain-containing protein [Bartonella sp. WD12.1]